MKILLLPVLALIICSSSFAQSDRQMEKRFNEEAVPKDVLKKGYVLLVKIPYDSKTWINKFTSAMEDHYSGPFEVVPYKKAIDENYKDTSTYKYVLCVSNSINKMDFVNVKQKTIFNPTGAGTMNITRSALFIIDRTDFEKSYNSGLEAQNVMKIVEFYADKLSGK